MEHLGNGVAACFDSPRCLKGFKYDNQGFQTYLTRAGWELDAKGVPQTTSLFKGDFKQGSHGSWAAFLQAWLFFGLLTEVLGEEAHVDVEDFVKPDDYGVQWITTERLPKYLKAWADRETKETPGRNRRMIRAQLALNRARYLVSTYCSVSDAEGNPQWPVEEVLCLSFMVLGETLTHAKAQILKSTKSDIRGWLWDADEGWGSSKAVFKRFDHDGWCPNAVHVLQGQLRSHVTGLLYVLSSHARTPRDNLHHNCASQPCKFQQHRVQGNNAIPYQTKHREKGCGCKHIEPRLKDLQRIIGEKRTFPLLRYDSEGERIDVKEFDKGIKYAIISHVWSDGYGNPSANSLPKCQLDFFQGIFQDIENMRQLPRYAGKSQVAVLFWIDTLAIPVHETNAKERRMAIKKMHEIYIHADYTIVLDNGLMAVNAGGNYEDTAMRILSSRWMRRLWTLQEAYLSDNLYFNFNDTLIELGQLERLFRKASDVLESRVAMAARTYFHNLMGPQRLARGGLPRVSGATPELVASVWKVVQWRTTSHAEHETLALATLLQVDTDLVTERRNITMDQAGTSDDDLQWRMRALLSALGTVKPSAIPSGMIFLPGPRLTVRGFGWAPKTWMAERKVDHPDPLSRETHAATLRDEGLEVTYPGFLLHLLGKGDASIDITDELLFPSDSSLLEWYLITRADRHEDLPSGEQLSKPLAIILSSLKPKTIPEIAILVAIEENRGDVLHVGILCRVWINREIRENKMALLSSGFRDNEFGGTACGEAMDSQRWCVDGLSSVHNSVGKVIGDATPDTMKTSYWASFISNLKKPFWT